MLPGAIENLLRCIQAQTVEMKLIYPIRGIDRKELADGPAVFVVKVNRLSPFILMTISEVVFGKLLQVIAVGAEMVVHDVQNDANAKFVRAIYEFTQIIRAAVKASRGEEVHSVVTPAKAARKFCYRHNLDEIDAQFS